MAMPQFLSVPVDYDPGDDGPPLPRGRRVRLPGRGDTFVRELEGPPGAPTVLLLHGWLASGGLNWFQTFGPLSQRFRVVAIDHRGHGRGIRTRRFHLRDCADDAAALCHELGLTDVIACGYSMGGPIAQLLWRRHPDVVGGLVFAATSHSFVMGQAQRLVMVSAMQAAAGTAIAARGFTLVPSQLVRMAVGVEHHDLPVRRQHDLQSWAAAEIRRHDRLSVLQAGRSIGSYDARQWIGDVDVPTASLVTTGDRAVPASRQRELARATHAEVFDLDGGHAVCALPQFGPAVAEACSSVAARLQRRPHLVAV